jgi:hypothetical protein
MGGDHTQAADVVYARITFFSRILLDLDLSFRLLDPA